MRFLDRYVSWDDEWWGEREEENGHGDGDGDACWFKTEQRVMGISEQGD